MSEKKTLTRSEIVRQRRLEQLRQAQQEKLQDQQDAYEQPAPIVQRPARTPRPAKKKPAGKNGNRDLPPITARGVVNDFAIERRKNAQKRRFNMVFSMPRPQVRTLSLPTFQIGIGWRLLSAFLVLLLGAALYLAWTLPGFRVSNAQVTGNQWITTDEINSVLGLSGFPIFLLTPDHIRDQVLRNYPELASIDVSISMPNTVAIHVTERQPVILWHQDGGFTWIDETGTAFRPRGEAQGLVIVQALGGPPEVNAVEAHPHSLSPFLAKETVQAIRSLAPHVPQGTPLQYDPVMGLGWTDGRGWQVVFGASGDMSNKILVYRAMVEWLSQRGIRPVFINVAYPQAPFYRLQPVGTPAEVEEQ